MTRINIQKLKEFANQLPRDWPLREILLLTESEVDIDIFLACLPVYLRLSRLKHDQRS